METPVMNDLWLPETLMASSSVSGVYSDVFDYNSKRYRCTQCSKTYMWKTTLARHVKYECGKPPQFQCPFCQKRSHRKSNIEQHIRCHHRM
ncbi:longitudinals lacking protein-like [Schistocerca serialis cubense]|uniref:longitudinals lacking protein-like n=1 Tax=Schistocerca serialis cubense TaxID=2023355 RepID=UPI00214EFAE3|nr:longitudinals lacking protein-like [Schistocerca serialis cubense]